MAALWGMTNGLVEAAAFRMRLASGAVRPLTYFVERFEATEGVAVDRQARLGRPYVRLAAVTATLLLVDAALLAVR